MKMPNTPIELGESLSPELQRLAKQSKEELDGFLSFALARIGRTAVGNMQSAYSEFWELPRVPDMLEALRGRVVVDLGCGDDKSFKKSLGRLNLAAYIGVDQLITYGFRPFEKTPFGVVIPLSVEAGDAVNGSLIRTDMLEFVGRLPVGSCSFVINGIDSDIINPYSDYAKELVEQIDRATEAGGYVIGVAFRGGILGQFSDMPGYSTEVYNPSSSVEYISARKAA